jgi:hypothetical protein
MLWLINLGFAASAADAPPAPVVDATPTPAGKPRKHRYFVEIDGQQFLVDSAEAARQLLQQARAIAESQSEKKAKKAERYLKKRASIPKVELPEPVIRVSAEIAPDLVPVIDDIKRLYRQAAELAELRLLMLKQRQAEDDDEDDVLLLI